MKEKYLKKKNPVEKKGEFLFYKLATNLPTVLYMSTNCFCTRNELH